MTGLPDGGNRIAEPPLSATPLSRVARGSVATLAGAGISAVVGFALTVVITRSLTKPEAGVFFSVTSLFLVVVSVGLLGTDLGLVYFLSRARALGQRGAIGGYLRTALLPVCCVAAAMSAAIYAAAPVLGRLTNPHHASEASRYLHTLALFVVPACLATALLAATRGLGTMRAGVLVEQIGRQLAQLALVSIAVAAASTRWLGWAWALPYLGSFLAALLWCRRLRTAAVGPDPGAACYPLPVRAFWRFTAPRTLASVAQLLLQRVDIVLVAALAGAADAALFTASTRFVVVGQAVGYAISLALQPQLASELARSDLLGARRLFQTSAAWLVGFTWPLYLTFCVHGRELLSVFGGGYLSGATVLALVACGLLVGTAVGDVDSVLVMSGRTVLSMANTVLGLVVMIGLDLWLIPRHGALGAALGWGGALVVKNLAGLVQVHRVYRMHPFSTASALAMALAAVCFGGISGGTRLLVGSGWWALVSGLSLAATAYLAGLWLLRGPLHLAEFGAVRRGGGRARSG
jgi:O-antigen/teichoic acid export membrane protein